MVRGHMKALGMSSTSDTHVCDENIQKSSTLDDLEVQCAIVNYDHHTI